MKPVTLRYRLAVAARALAAIVGGYAVASTATILLSAVLPLARVDRILIATSSSFIFMTLAVMWSFYVTHWWRSWLDLFVVSLILGGIGYWVGPVS